MDTQPVLLHTLPPLPRDIDPQQVFNSLADWMHNELIVKRHAPGFVVGLSGTDSILTYLICVKAFEKAGRPERVAGIHFGAAPSENTEKTYDTLLLNNKICQIEKTEDTWFQQSVIPWLREQTPHSQIIVSNAIDFRSDGQRWGALMDWSVIANPVNGHMRRPEDRFWVAGTRNRTEQILLNFSNVSNAASIQPVIHLWKSEVLKICAALNVPQEALTRSRQTDCACGRFDLPATYIEFLDALLMIDKKELDPQFARENIPPAILEELRKFVDDQINAARFKPEIPYIPDPHIIQRAPDMSGERYADAKYAAEDPDNADIRAISALVPDIIHRGNANAASDLVCTHSNNRTPWLPEAMMLFNTPGLLYAQKKRMLEVLFSCPDTGLMTTHRASDCTARIARYGFSFPKWRFLTQRSGEEPSLVEHFGMQRLTRENDTRDASLPPSDPARDFLGTGFVWYDTNWYTEYRRAYIVCAALSGDHPATIVIRNNSWFFGRDRLPNPVYISTNTLTAEELQHLTPGMLENSGHFTKWQDIARSIVASDPDEMTDKMEAILIPVETTLNYLDHFDQGLVQWLQSDGPTAYTGAGPDHSQPTRQGGFKHLRHFLSNRASSAAAMIRPALYIGETEPAGPPWFPAGVEPLSTAWVQSMKPGSNPRFTLLSGPDGDYPDLSQKQTTRPLAPSNGPHKTPYPRR